MNRKTLNIWFTILIIVSLLACTLPKPKTPTVEPTAAPELPASTRVREVTPAIAATGSVADSATEAVTDPVADPEESITPTPTATQLPATALPPAPAGPDVTPLQAQLDLPAGTVIALRQTGGFAGVDNLYIYYEDGRIDTPAGEQVTVTAEDMAAQLATLDAAGFFEMTQPKSKPICCDHFTYTLYARDGDRENVITVSGGDPDLAPELLEIILALQSLAVEAEGS